MMHSDAGTAAPRRARRGPPARAWVEAFDARRRGAAGEPPWLQRRRTEARERLLERGFPGRDDEDWRETDIGPLADRPPSDRPAAEPSPAAISEALDAIAGLDRTAPYVVLVDGRYAAGASRRDGLGEGIAVGSLREAIERTPERLERHLGTAGPAGHVVFDLVCAGFDDGLWLHVAGDAGDPPLQVVHLALAPGASIERTLVVVERGGRLRMIEFFAGSASARVHGAEFVLCEDARLEHFVVESDGEPTWHARVQQARLAERAAWISCHLAAGAGTLRADLGVTLEGEAAHATLDGLALAGGERHVDHHTTIDHAVAGTTSAERFAGVLAERGRAVFRGRIVVRPGAQKTDAEQSCRHLLLSDDALVQARPQLEIYADDVRCTHGATVGRLDDDALFYLRSRGIPRAQARRLLVESFARRVVAPHAPAAALEWTDRRIGDLLARQEAIS